MNWLNINVAVLDSPEFLGSEPIDRATWLCLLRYCVGQENGGVISGCRSWQDRKWQQIVRVTHQETQRETQLWYWRGDDLVLTHYPVEKEREIHHLRAIGKTSTPAKQKAARENGKSGGRPLKNDHNPTETQHETQQEPNKKPIEENRIEENRIEKKEEKPKTQAQEPKETHRPIVNGNLSVGAGEIFANAQDMQARMDRVNSLSANWTKLPRWTRAEMDALSEVAPNLDALDESDLATLRSFYGAANPGKDFFRPQGRGAFLGHLPAVLDNARRWAGPAKRKSNLLSL